MPKIHYENILQRLESLGGPKAVVGMARFGINTENAYGVPIQHLRKIAKETGNDHVLAEGLWAYGFQKGEMGCI